jgi:hypothetical protein
MLSYLSANVHLNRLLTPDRDTATGYPRIGVINRPQTGSVFAKLDDDRIRDEGVHFHLLSF